jgi:hypothetical protein
MLPNYVHSPLFYVIYQSLSYNYLNQIGNYMYHFFNIYLDVFPTRWVYLFPMILKTNSDYFRKQINRMVLVIETRCVFCSDTVLKHEII